MLHSDYLCCAAGNLLDHPRLSHFEHVGDVEQPYNHDNSGGDFLYVGREVAFLEREENQKFVKEPLPVLEAE